MVNEVLVVAGAGASAVSAGNQGTTFPRGQRGCQSAARGGTSCLVQSSQAAVGDCDGRGDDDLRSVTKGLLLLRCPNGLGGMLARARVVAAYPGGYLS